MPPVEDPPVAPVAPSPDASSVLPASIAKVVKPADFGAIADQFGAPDSSRPVAPKPPVAPKAEPKVELEAPVAPKGIADRLAAKQAAPKVPAENQPPKTEVIAPKVEPKAGDQPPPAAKNPEDDLELSEKSSEVARENFKKLKGITKGVRDQLITKDREVTELRAKLETAAKAPAAVDTEKLTRLEAEHKALSDRLLLIDTQNHPTFQQQFVAPKNAALAAAKELIPAEKNVDLAKLLALPRTELGRAVAEITKDLPDLDRADVSQSILKAWTMEQQGNEALKNASTTYQHIRQKTEAEQRQVFEQAWVKVAPAEQIATLEIPADATPEERQSIETYNQESQGLRTRAEQIALGKIGEGDVASHAIKAASYDFHVKHVLPRIGREYGQLQLENQRLQKELDGYKSRNPNRDLAPLPGTREVPAPKGDSIESVANAMFPSRG